MTAAKAAVILSASEGTAFLGGANSRFFVASGDSE